MTKAFDDFMDKRKPIELRRKKMDSIKDKLVEIIMADMDMEAEIVWILQGSWHDKQINPNRIPNEEKGCWNG